MSTFVKVLIAAVVLIALLVVAVVGAGVYWWSRNGKAYIENARNSVKEGAQFGIGTDNEGCVAEAVSRHNVDHSFGTVINTRLFLTGCLTTAEPVEGFCDAVPEQTAFMESARWQTEQCKQAGLTDGLCPQMFTEVQKYCDSNELGARRAAKANQNATP
jgi:hypothetical protein